LISLFLKIISPVLPAFAECPVRNDGGECEKGIHEDFNGGGYASVGFAKAVKMARVEARGASLRLRSWEQRL
jgi:hypothetical protein